MTNSGKSLERLIYAIEKALGDEKSVTVETPKRLTDKTTGKLREHDVVLTVTQQHHTFRIAIECRDHARPITVNQVEGFWAKCQHTGINQGVLVSTSGFYNTAREKADQLDIRCLDIEEVESFQWLVGSGIYAVNRNLDHHAWTFFPKDKDAVQQENMEVLGPNGEAVDDNVLMFNALRWLNEFVSADNNPVESAYIDVRFPSGGLTIRDKKTGATTAVTHGIVRLTFSITQRLIPFRLNQYLNKKDDEHITDAATAEIDFGNTKGELVIVFKENEGGQVMFVPHGAKKND